MYWNGRRHSQLNVCNCIPHFYFNFHSTTERKSSHHYLPVTSLLTTSSEPLVPPVPESAQLPYKVCLQLGLGARQDRKQRLYFPGKIQGFNLIAFSFITDNRRRFCWATYSSRGFSCVPWLKRGLLYWDGHHKRPRNRVGPAPTGWQGLRSSAWGCLEPTALLGTVLWKLKSSLGCKDGAFGEAGRGGVVAEFPPPRHGWCGMAARMLTGVLETNATLPTAPQKPGVSPRRPFSLGVNTVSDLWEPKIAPSQLQQAMC